MSETQSDTIKESVARVAEELGLGEPLWGSEDGYTWLLFEDESITPDRYKELSQAIANASGVEFYFSKISCGSMEGAVNWNMREECAYTDEDNCDIDDYGTLFSPVPPVAKPRSPGMR